MASADSSTALLRIDQVGSLVAPGALIDAFDKHAMGNLTADQLKSAQDTAIRAVVQEQERRRTSNNYGRRVSSSEFSGELQRCRSRL